MQQKKGFYPLPRERQSQIGEAIERKREKKQSHGESATGRYVSGRGGGGREGVAFDKALGGERVVW